MAAELLPTEKEMPGVLRRLTLAGQQCGVQFESFRPDPEIRKDHYTEVPIQLKIVGGYHQVGQFLAEVANMPRIMRVSNLQVLANPKGEDDQTTAADLVITVYTLNPEGSAPATKPGAADAKTGGKANGSN
jgi:type IV pilus assembly protein PilO